MPSSPTWSPLGQSRVISVIGVHRSGTSVLTKGLETLGVSLGNTFIESSIFNEKGFWEDEDFHSLNFKMLNSFGDRFRLVLPVTEDEVGILCEKGFLRGATQLLLAKLPSLQPLGLKDPRATLLLPFWKKVFRNIRVAPSFVIALRHPFSAIAYQEQHYLQDREEAFWTWVSYLVTCLTQSEGSQRIIVDYDELLKNPTAQMERVAEVLQLKVDPALLQSYHHDFVDSSLCHYRKKEECSSPPSFWQNFALEIYHELFRVATDQASFEEIQPAVEKWNNQWELMRPSLKIEEEKNLRIFFFKEKNHQLLESNKRHLQTLINLNEKLVEKCELIAKLYAAGAGHPN